MPDLTTDDLIAEALRHDAAMTPTPTGAPPMSDPTASRVREAAERLRNEDYPFGPNVLHEMADDRRILADVYLREHRADDETAVTLDEVAGLPRAIRRVGKDDSVELGRANFYTNTAGDKLYAASDDIPIRTRGELRRLLAALGIPLSPPPGDAGEPGGPARAEGR